MLVLEKTTYHCDLEGLDVDVVVETGDEKRIVRVRESDREVYYYVAEDKAVLYSDEDLAVEAMRVLKKDETRWLVPSVCERLSKCCETKKNKLKSKDLQYSTTMHGLDFKITIQIYADSVFRMQLTNNKNGDIMTCFAEAANFKDLLSNIFIYDNVINAITDAALKDQNLIMGGEFSRFLKQ